LRPPVNKTALGKSAIDWKQSHAMLEGSVLRGVRIKEVPPEDHFAHFQTILAERRDPPNEVRRKNEKLHRVVIGRNNFKAD
jgi:hypothetical protein